MSESSNLRIIVIDDNPSIHQDFIKILMKDKSEVNDSKILGLEEKLFGEAIVETELPEFEINTASQGKEGVQMIARAIKEGRPYSVAFVDIRMPPGWDGVETIKHIWELDPNVQAVICTAYSDYTWEETVNQLGERDNLLILKKPFDNIAVRQLACALTKKWTLGQEVKYYTHSLEKRVKSRTESLRKSLSLMQATLESSADGIIVVDNSGKITNYNKKFIELWQISNEIANTTDFSIINKFMLDKIQTQDESTQKLESLIQNFGDTGSGSVKLKDQRVFDFFIQPYKVSSQGIGLVLSFRDATTRVSLENELLYHATHDPLTDLPNRIFLLDQMRKKMAKSDQKHSRFGVMFLDLDRFKLINDSLSHEAGDEILRMVADRLKSVVSDKDILVRHGGDEFVIVVDEFEDETELTQLANKIISIFNEPFRIYDHSIVLTMSIGICIYPKDGKNIEVLLKKADRAMYQAKETGPNECQFYTAELDKKSFQRLKHESELRQALKNNEFFLYYQPQIDLSSEKLVSVEALIRWKHPKKGIVLPIDFIPIAEESGLIVPIGEWVLRTACKQNKEWQKMGLPPIRVAVNITTKQLKAYDFSKMVCTVLEETQLDPKYLELELTENIIINNSDIIKTLQDIKKMGIQIVLDDFGTGYSSLNYLREIPVDRLKIDQSYVRNIETKRGDNVIIEAIITLAKNLHLEVLAEGVENQRQIDFLKSQKCEEVQGYYFSKPISAKEFEKLMKKSKGKFSMPDL